MTDNDGNADDLSDLPGLEDDDLPDDSPEEQVDPKIESITGDIEAGGREAAWAPRSRLRRKAVGASLFVAALFGIFGLFWLGDGDDDSSNLEAQSSEQTDTADDKSSTSAACDDAVIDRIDSRFRVSCVDAILDRQNQLWINIAVGQGWGQTPPGAIKSGFFRATVSYNPTIELGWETHEGVETVLGTPTEAYILENGSVLFATGLSPAAPYQLDIGVAFASWQEETAPVVTGEFSTFIGSEVVATGDPFTGFGGPPVFDLMTSSPIDAG